MPVVAVRVKEGVRILRKYNLHSVDECACLSEFARQVLSGENDSSDGYSTLLEKEDVLRFQVCVADVFFLQWVCFVSLLYFSFLPKAFLPMNTVGGQFLLLGGGGGSSSSLRETEEVTTHALILWWGCFDSDQ